MAKKASKLPLSDPNRNDPSSDANYHLPPNFITSLVDALGGRQELPKPSPLDERIDAARAEAGSMLRHLAERFNIGHERLVALADGVAADIKTYHAAVYGTSYPPMETDESPPPLPTTAPLLWRDRAKEDSPIKRLNPAQFVQLIYGDWFGHGMTRVLLRKLDPDLYRALSVFEHRHPEYRLSELPTLAEVIDQKIAALASEFTPDELRKLGSTLQTRHRRAKK